MVTVYYCYRCRRNVSVHEDNDRNLICDECHDPFIEIRDEPIPQLPPFLSNIFSPSNGFQPTSYEVLPGGGISMSFTTTPGENRVGYNFLNSIFGPSFGVASGMNPGDYFDGNLEQLLNLLMQNDPNRHGSPPTSRDFIKNMVHRHPTSAEMATNPVCAVCDCDITTDDTIVCLPCKHIYHPDCITPWIKRHSTCPVCRAGLPVMNSDEEESDDEEGRDVAAVPLCVC